MKDYKYINRAKILNPFIVCLYVIGCYFFVELTQYGGSRGKVPIILIAFALILAWFIYMIIKVKNQLVSGILYLYTSEISKKSRLYKWWFYIAIVIVVFTTLLTGYNIY